MSVMRAASELRLFYALVLLGALAVGGGVLAAHTLDVHGHVITGMDNQIVWGLPHVFAIFLIVTASGVLNVASVGSVFGFPEYKSRAPLSGLLSIGLLLGGLSVLMLDLGRPDRVMVAVTHFNFHSIFAWNVFLYSGLLTIVAAYVWTMMERRMNRWSRPLGFAALLWRFVLTTGTGSIFGFLVARQAYQSAILAPTFIVASLAWGLGIFLIVQEVMYAWNDRQLEEPIQVRMNHLLAIFVALTLYFTTVYHVTNAYYARQAPFERFLLVDGPLFPALFWAGYVLAGSLVPLLLLLHPRLGGRRTTLLAALLVVCGAGCDLYVFIIGGQAFPLSIFPGFAVHSTFADGAIAHYSPRWPEWLLGMGGLGIAFLLTTVGVRALPLLPGDRAHAPSSPRLAKPAGAAPT